MAGQELTITGLTEKMRALERLGVDTQDLQPAFERIAQGAVRDAQSAVRVKTGALYADIRVAHVKGKWVVRAGDSLDYAGVQNYDPERGNEFLTGPANRNESEQARQIEAELKTIIRKYDL
ncbi:hypothetical protein [Aeromicrobium sp.]|uniref:hypothetical protein n=1 Tax=Aeromicrobium sp. TaxID=1871063 RepID=UPI0030BF4F2C